MAHLDFTVEDDVLKAVLLGERGDALRVLLEAVLNALLQAEASDQIGAGPYERSAARVTYRNGYRERPYTTRVGTLTLQIPKLRNGTFSTQLFQRYERSEQALCLSLMEMVLQGVSCRKVKQITETLCGTSFSKSTVSALCQRLDEEVSVFRQRPLSGHYPFVMVDALYTKVRERSAVRSKGLLIAVGINEEGHREVLGFSAGDSESYTTWSDLFRDLRSRGLSGVDLVVSDDHRGLVKAIREHFDGAIWQRCQVHFMRNLLAVTPSALKSKVRGTVRDLFTAPDYETALSRREDVLTALVSWGCQNVADRLDEAFDDVMAVFSLPERYRRRLRSTNMLERLNQEIRRRERVIRIFPNGSSMIRLIGALLIQFHEDWMSGRHYFAMGEYHAGRVAAAAEEMEEDKKDKEGVA